MKQLILYTLAAFVVVGVFAQSPEKMSYQAVVRDAKGILVSTQTIGMRISITTDLNAGEIVYSEMQNPMTNANGLVSIEVGNGTVVVGDFSTIEWSDGEYFIQTEIDPTGGTNYTITGISQLLSVPYALHAKTAENIAGGTPEMTTYEVGDFAHGGIVFWVDETRQHGLVCAIIDQSSGIRWHAGTFLHTMANGNGIYSGAMNTAIIIARNGYGDGSSYAASICAELEVVQNDHPYGDWYLPSRKEMLAMYKNKAIINNASIANGGSNLSNDIYWTSTENDSNSDSTAEIVYYSNGGYGGYGKNFPARVRAIRTF